MPLANPTLLRSAAVLVTSILASQKAEQRRAVQFTLSTSALYSVNGLLHSSHRLGDCIEDHQHAIFVFIIGSSVSVGCHWVAGWEVKWIGCHPSAHELSFKKKQTV
jgi:hypothetical protein